MTECTGSQEFIRRVNDSIYGMLVTLDVEDGEFWCECPDMDCEQRLLLTLREYAALRERDGAELLARRHPPVGVAQ